MNTRMHQIIKRSLGLLLALVMCGICTACGNSPQAVSDAGEGQDHRYSIQLREIPDPDQALYESDILQGHEDCQVLERKRICQGSRIYRFMVALKEDFSYYENILQIFDEGTWSWEQMLIPQEGWIEGRYITINTMVGATEEGIFLQLTDYGEEEQAYLGYFDGAAKELLMEWPKEAKEALVCRDLEQNTYFVDSDQGIIYAYDGNGKQRKRFVLDAYLEGGLCHPLTGDMLWYGSTNGELRFWRDAGKPSSYESNKEAAPYESRIAYGPDGTLYYADTQAVWLQGSSPRQILAFGDSGYLPQELYSIRVQGDGDILCHVTIDGSLCLMSLHQLAEGEASERQEITLYGYADIFLQQLVTRFNRQNSQYHITILDPADYPRAQIEIADGKGPDLFFLSPLEAADYARQGYIQEMEGIIEDPSLFLDAALESGRVNGVTYGIPYSCTLHCLVFSREIAGDSPSWTVEQMMQVVRESEAKTLYWYFSQYNAYEIVLKCGLYDNENAAYIDWKEGKSHLAEQPFMELLEFAREYADAGEYDSTEVLSMLQGGEIAGMELRLWKPGLLDYADTCFLGEASYIGYPTSNGRKGVYVQTNCLYVNQAASQTEGIREFMQFILREESQSLCVADAECYSMPIRLSTISDLVKQEQKRAENEEKPLIYEDGFVSWQEDGLDQEQMETLQELLTQAQPYKFYAMELEDILYEELEPYFSGARSLEETVAMLDNRVQVYLNERDTD